MNKKTHVIDISVLGILEAKVVLAGGEILKRCVVNIDDSGVEQLVVSENGDAFGVPVIIAFRSIVSSIFCKHELLSDEVLSEEDYSRVTVDRYRERPGNLKSANKTLFWRVKTLTWSSTAWYASKLVSETFQLSSFRPYSSEGPPCALADWRSSSSSSEGQVKTIQVKRIFLDTLGEQARIQKQNTPMTVSRKIGWLFL